MEKSGTRRSEKRTNPERPEAGGYVSVHGDGCFVRMEWSIEVTRGSERELVLVAQWFTVVLKVDTQKRGGVHV